ncbi:MAG: nucleoside triphosphate pyrophosphohydrolase [Euzebya sp.]
MEGRPTARLLLVDTVDQLPGLLPWHAFQALRSCDLIILGRADHPLASHLDMALQPYEVIPADVGQQAIGRSELLGGLSLTDKARSSWVIKRITDTGSCGYVFGPGDTDAFTRTLGMDAARAEIEVEIVYFGLAPSGLKVLELVKVQQRLLAPDGCPWDAEQTHATLAPYAIEEAHELAEAIASDDPSQIQEELGDVLLQVVFNAELSDSFDIDGVAQGITDKLIRRHPHVFADGQADTVLADTALAVQANWDQIKALEKPERTGPFAGVPSGLPAVALTAKIQSRAERLGFAWADREAAAEKVAEELGEVIDAVDVDLLRHEVGDLLFAAISLARTAGVDPEDALRRAVVRFRERFEELVAVSGEAELAELTPQQWQQRWDATTGS